MSANPACMRREGGETLIILSDGSVIRRKEKPSVLLSEKCLRYGSTLKGRTEAVSRLLEIRQKPPVLISERTMEMGFGTMSMKDEACEWFSYREILQIKGKGRGTEVTFVQGGRVTADADPRILKRQMERCVRLLSILTE